MGDPAARIAEDYLRVLRLFRFHAWYGRGEIDPPGLRAAAAAKDRLGSLSAERVAKEMLRLLEAAAPGPVLRVMAAAGLLSTLLPGAVQLGRLERLVAIDADNFFPPDPLLRLAALLEDSRAAAEAAADRLKLSNADRARLSAALGGDEKIVSYLSVKEVRRLLYRIGPERFRDRVRLNWAGQPKGQGAIQWRMLLAVADSWERPRFPLTGREVMLAGVPEGPAVGHILAAVEAWWAEGDFSADDFALAERLKAIVQARDWA
jgi:poly(A) polymerase